MDHKIKTVVAGVAGAGKTTLAATLPGKTLIFSMEAGTLSLNGTGFDGHVREISTFDSFMDNMVWAFGPDTMRKADEFLSEAHYERVLEKTGGKSFEEMFPGVEYLFIDSLTELSRLVLKHAERHPDALNKEGKKDGFAVYGMLGQRMMDALIHARNSRKYHVVFSAIIEPVKNGLDQTWQIQMEGSKAGRELMGIVDAVLLIGQFVHTDGKSYRAIFTEPLQMYPGFQPKFRSGNLKPVEPANLGGVYAKMMQEEERPLSFDLPEGF